MTWERYTRAVEVPRKCSICISSPSYMTHRGSAARYSRLYLCQPIQTPLNHQRNTKTACEPPGYNIAPAIGAPIKSAMPSTVKHIYMQVPTTPMCGEASQG
ncbi:hypothetical protein BJX63DRAFT_416394 [Aspergillus granulosus]|uniref:Uncharacterized protein n=1 Tax=Aspergillus granulosus TaxID=176169 RepID=A0ABR4GS27_9EURO